MTTSQHFERVAMPYIRAIRNQAKHDYALAYYVALVNHQGPPSVPTTLSCMGAQAVRLRLRELARRAGFDAW